MMDLRPHTGLPLLLSVAAFSLLAGLLLGRRRRIRA